jgi:hypothetical protein
MKGKCVSLIKGYLFSHEHEEGIKLFTNTYLIRFEKYVLIIYQIFSRTF